MYKCTKCFSPEVEKLSWLDLNTGEEQDGEVGEYYCRSCGAQTDVYYDNVGGWNTKPNKDEDTEMD